MNFFIFTYLSLYSLQKATIWFQWYLHCRCICLNYEFHNLFAFELFTDFFCAFLMINFGEISKGLNSLSEIPHWESSVAFRDLPALQPVLTRHVSLRTDFNAELFDCWNSKTRQSIEELNHAHGGDVIFGHWWALERVYWMHTKLNPPKSQRKKFSEENRKH